MTQSRRTMRKITTFLFIVLFSAVSVGTASAQIARTGEPASLRDALKVMLQEKGAAGLKKLTVNVSGDQSTGFMDTYGVDTEGSYTVYNGTTSDGGIMGSVLVVNQAGKEGPLQVLVAIDPDGSVYDVGFTVFGEDKGKPAMKWTFLKQFMGVQADQQVEIGEDIDGISGATWTSESIATAVKRGLAVFTEFIAD